MDDERPGTGRREPLWPADSEPARPARRPTPIPPPSVSDAPTEHMPAPRLTKPPVSDAQAISDAPTEHIAAPALPDHQGRAVSDAPTARIPVTSMPVSPASAASSVSDAPTARITAAPRPLRSSPPVPAPRQELPPLPAPLRPPAPPTPPTAPEAALAWARAHIRLVASGAVVIALVASVLVYLYAAGLAAQPRQIAERYCADLARADYQSAYGLLDPALRSRESLAQFESDGAALDTISGRVTACAAGSEQGLSALTYLTNPGAVLIPLSLTRRAGAQGQMSLVRDTSGWRVAGLAGGVAGVDLGPLHAEQALCAAFTSRQYDVAFGLLSAAYQRQEGSAQSFARSFGAHLAITRCEPALGGYTLDRAGQRASFPVTLNLSVTGGGAVTQLTLPAKITLVRERAGWRVDALTPALSQ
ncbi:MAG TPA: hypothetical protein VF808_10140 [Ktedonobacterales bacterium]